jgi:hypothetical protein
VAADRRPIDPPPIVQLVVRQRAATEPGSSDAAAAAAGASADVTESAGVNVHQALQNPYYFMFASLAKPDEDVELHWLKVEPLLITIVIDQNINSSLSIQDGKTCSTTGSVVSSLYHLKDIENDNIDAGFFVFPDLSVRTEGSYRLKLTLFELVG